MLPGSGGLECEVGQLGKLVSPTRTGLAMGICEAQMLPKLNPCLREWNTLQIKKLGRDWEQYAPNRDAIWKAYEDLLQLEEEEQEMELGEVMKDEEADGSASEDEMEEEAEES